MHSPGPWLFEEPRWVIDANGKEVARASSNDSLPSNVALIKCAPQLLAELKKIEWKGVTGYDDPACPCCKAYDWSGHKYDCTLNNIIKMAEGRA